MHEKMSILNSISIAAINSQAEKSFNAGKALPSMLQFLPLHFQPY